MRGTNAWGETRALNPVVQVIATRTLQATAVTLPLLLAARATLPRDRCRTVWVGSGVAVTAGLSAYFLAAFSPRSWIPGGPPPLVRLPCVAGRAIALTFDDGPHPETTPELLDVLAAGNAKATFFVVGERASRYPALVRRMAAEGHAVGLHGLRHRSMVLMPPRQIRTELQEAARRIEDAAGVPLGAPRLLRPPYGFRSGSLVRAAAQQGFRIVAWSLDLRDYDPVSAERLVRRAAKRVAPGDIVLLHERPDAVATREALPDLLAVCAGKGLRCLPIGPDQSISCFQPR